MGEWESGSVSVMFPSKPKPKTRKPQTLTTQPPPPPPPVPTQLPREEAAVRYVLKVQECDPAWVPPHDVRGMADANTTAAGGSTTAATGAASRAAAESDSDSVVDGAPPSPRAVAQAAMPPRQGSSPSPSTPQTLKGESE